MGSACQLMKLRVMGDRLFGAMCCEGSSVCETVCNRLTLNKKGEGEKNTVHDFDDYGNPLNLLKKTFLYYAKRQCYGYSD